MGTASPLDRWKAWSADEDLVHVHQKALVAAEEPPVPQLLLHGVQRLIDHVGLAVPAVEHALCVLAFHI